MDDKIHSPEYYKEFLLKIYKCKIPFELRFRNTKPKSYCGLYYPGRPGKINLYPKWAPLCPLKEVAIHEYAHHIHRTEYYNRGDSKLDRGHGHNFMRIYSALRAKAVSLGLYEEDRDGSDELIERILMD